MATPSISGPIRAAARSKPEGWAVARLAPLPFSRGFDSLRLDQLRRSAVELALRELLEPCTRDVTLTEHTKSCILSRGGQVAEVGW